MVKRQKTRRRKDHILPQGYLRGFIDPLRNRLNKPLWVYDTKARVWAEKSTREVAFEYGFYDYAKGGKPDATADEAFAELERNFPLIRARILKDGFQTWVNHKSFLLRFAEMLRVRSILFRQQHINMSKDRKFLRLGELLKVEPDPKNPSQMLKTFRFEEAFPSQEELRNFAITEMRTMISKGAGWFEQLHWALRFTTNPNDPMVTTNNPLYGHGKHPTLQLKVQDPDFLLFFPISWQMCLAGSWKPFIKETDAFHPADLVNFRKMFSTDAQIVISPTKIDL